jgi:hypothetical protein
MTVGGRNDMQRVNGLRIEEESRLKAEQAAAVRLPHENFDSPRQSRFGSILGKIRSAVRR